MQKTYIINFLIFLVSFYAISQNESANWYFGNGAGISFANGIRTTLNDGIMYAPAGCSSISDSDGNLLFYTNGETIWNRNHVVMENGNNLAGVIENTQSSIIIPDPNNNSAYYVFTTRKQNGNSFIRGIYYSKVEFSNENPLGTVTIKNILIASTSSERITAMYLPESNIYKLIALGEVFAPPVQFPETPILPDGIANTFFIITVTDTGVETSSIITIDTPPISHVGVLKISPNGEILAVADQGSGRLRIYDLDMATDSIIYSKYIFTGLFGAPDIGSYGVEFSPDSKIIYWSTYIPETSSNAIYKYLLTSEEYANDKIYIGGSINAYGSLQLAMDGKIYIANYSINGSSSNHISVINNPNAPEADCGLETLSIDLNTGESFKGLPNFVQSFFENRILTENRCVTDSFDFDVNAYGPVQSVLWAFGDGSTSTSLITSHQFQNAGSYIVKATIEVYGRSIDLYKQIDVYPLPVAEAGITINQCDTDNDGISFFNLNDYQDYIENNDSIDYALSFFHTYEQAVGNTEAISNPEAYQNSTNPEQVFVRIVNPNGCLTVSDFFIQSTFASLDNIRNIYVCEGSDTVFGNSIGRFDLRPIPNEIRLQFGIPETATITFYATLQDAQTRTNPLNLNYLSNTTTIWVRVDEANGGCGGVGAIQLYVSPNLVIDLEESYMICHSSLQPPLVLDGVVSNDRWEWKDSNGNILSTQRFFYATEPGSYSLTVYKTDNDLECSMSKSFTVNNFGTPSFEYLIGDNYQIQVSINGSSSYEYSLNGTQYFGQGTTHTFSGIEAGVYTVFVRDIANCEPPISQKVSFVGLPKFFTPNNDTYNDTWKIEGLSDDLYVSAEVNIYDRYGKFLYSMDLETNNYGWDGTFENNRLTPTDYWFVAKLIDMENNVINKTGHFALIL